MLAIKKKICVILYIATLYYLLPFRPLYLYYSTESRAIEIASKIRNHGKQKVFNCYGKTENLNNHHDIFPQKKRVKFFLYTLKFDEPLEFNNVFFSLEKSTTLSICQYKNYNLLVKHTRGPPAV